MAAALCIQNLQDERGISLLLRVLKHRLQDKRWRPKSESAGRGENRMEKTKQKKAGSHGIINTDISF